MRLSQVFSPLSLCHFILRGKGDIVPGAGSTLQRRKHQLGRICNSLSLLQLFNAGMSGVLTAASPATCSTRSPCEGLGAPHTTKASAMAECEQRSLQGNIAKNTQVDDSLTKNSLCGCTNPSSAKQNLLCPSNANSPTNVVPLGNKLESVDFLVSGLSEPSTSASTIAQFESDGSSFLPYVNYCAQISEQVAICCGKRGPSTTEEQTGPAPLRDSKRESVEHWLTRPARRQALAAEVQAFSHLEGQNEYNIWYGRHLTDRYNRPSHLDREAALYRCDPELDAGYTAADTQPGNSEASFCAFFAKGCCTKGSECRFKHRVPTLEDEGTLEWSRDIFGRQRHRDHRDDMGGAGSFNHDCRTLFVGGLQIDPLEIDGIQNLERFLWESFGVWGDVETVRVIPKKLLGFVTYAYRVQAEFAKVAMADQNFGKHGTLLSVKWAHQDGNGKRNDEKGDQSKKPKVERFDGRSKSAQSEQRDEDIVYQTLESYCSAWQAYWAASCVGGNSVDSASTIQEPEVVKPTFQWPARPQHVSMVRQHTLSSYASGSAASQWPNEAKDSGDADADTKRLTSILTRVDSLSTADFLNAAAIGSSST